MNIIHLYQIKRSCLKTYLHTLKLKRDYINEYDHSRRFIVTYSKTKEGSTYLADLEKQLRERGYTIGQRPREEMFATLMKTDTEGYFSEFIYKVLIPFISIFKTYNYHLDDFQKLYDYASPELKHQLIVLKPIYSYYQSKLEKEHYIDFNDMINHATEEVKKGKKLMGICLGMQLLFEKSFEYGEHEGLGLIKGEIRPLSEIVSGDLKIPHMGWNALDFTENETPVFKNVKNGDHVYFVHSFYAKTEEEFITATAEYGGRVTASVQCGNVFGCQFHPEKSGETGLKILKAFCDLEEKN